MEMYIHDRFVFNNVIVVFSILWF